jgi:tRNA A-37 threonylcarbamoyl transferase component Bud32
MNNIYYIKQNVSPNEYWMQKYAYSLCKKLNIPKIITYKMGSLKMVKINNMCVADFYGENWTDIPLKIKLNIHYIISELYKHSIAYPDISGYNFIEFNKRLWVIDFEHAFNINIPNLTQTQLKYIEFIKSFIKSPKGWNPYFK